MCHDVHLYLGSGAQVVQQQGHLTACLQKPLCILLDAVYALHSHQQTISYTEWGLQYTQLVACQNVH